MNPTTSAVVPAAGRSRRMGRAKELLRLRGVPAIRWAVQAALSAGVRDVVVVVGKNSARIRKALSDLPVRFVVDPAAGSGMAASVLAGLRALSPDCRDVFVLPGDHPMVSPQTLALLEKAYLADPEAVAVPSLNGQRGQLALFPVHVAMEVFSPHGPAHAPGIRENRVRQVPVPDPGILMDMNTPGDYKRIRKAARKLHGTWDPAGPRGLAAAWKNALSRAVS